VKRVQAGIRSDFEGTSAGIPVWRVPRPESLASLSRSMRAEVTASGGLAGRRELIEMNAIEARA